MYSIFEQLIKEKGVTPYRVYKETGVSQSTLSDWKNGKGTPKADSLMKLAEYLGVSIEYLLTGSEQKEKLTIVSDDELTPSQRAAMQLFQTVPDEDQAAVLGMIRGYLDSRK